MIEDDQTYGLGSFPEENCFRSRRYLDDETPWLKEGIPLGTGYATRGGEKAVIVGFDTQATNYPFYGHIVRADGKVHRTTWSRTGRNSYHDDADDPDDLVMPGAPEVDWARLPAWANYVALSPVRDGITGRWPWMWFAEKPTLRMLNDRPAWSASSGLCGMIPNDFAPIWAGEVGVSLAARPGLESSIVNWPSLPYDVLYVALSHDFATGKRRWMWFNGKPEIQCDGEGVRWTCHKRCGYIPDADAPAWTGDAQHSLMSRIKS